MADQIEQFLEAIGEKDNKFYIEKIQKNPGTIMENEKLVSVDLSGLELITLYPEMLAPLKGVETLILADNMLEYLPEGLFSELTGLKKLNLQGNPIYTYHPKAFVGLDELESLDLSRTQIFYLNQKIFDDLPNLKELDLSKTKLPASIRKRHSDTVKLKETIATERFYKKAPSRIYFWHNLTFSYLAILTFLLIPVFALKNGNSLDLTTGILFMLGILFLFLDFGVMKREIVNASKRFS